LWAAPPLAWIAGKLGFVPLSKTGAELLFEVFSQRYERTSTLVTSNLLFQEWTEILGSERLTGALLDRLPTTFISWR
jgi:DNA replication protein DnaC